jgi:hypothetical protein
MFIGHFGFGLASKRAAPKASAGALLLAPLFLDAIWPVFLITGIETVRIDPGNTAFTPLDLHDYPWSHSLVMSIVWSLVVAAIYGGVTRYARGALVMGVGVFSHWVFDFITHKPDLPLYPGSSTYVGLGLWNSVAGTLAVEIPIYVAGVWIYARTTRPRDRSGRWAFWAMVVFVAVVYVSAVFGPPPPNEKILAVMGFVSWLFVPWAFGFDRHRVVAA